MEKSEQVTMDEYFVTRDISTESLGSNTLKRYIWDNRTEFDKLSNSDMKSLFDLVSICNKIPEAPPLHDHAMERNFEVIKFQSVFKDDSKSENDNDYPIKKEDNKRKIDEIDSSINEENNKKTKTE